MSRIVAVVSPTPSTAPRTTLRRRDTFIAPLLASCLVRPARASLVDETSATRVFAETSKSVARVAVVAPNGEISGRGSGVVWYIDDAYAYIATNAHCVVKGNENEKLVVMLASGAAAALDKDASYFVNRSTDIGFLKVPIGSFGADAPVAAKIGTSDNLRVGQSAFSLGFEEDGAAVLSSGTINGLKRKIPSRNGVGLKGLIQTDAQVTEFTSGGALCDSAGRVIGLNVVAYAGSQKRDPQGVNFAIPIDAVRLAAEQM